MKSILDDKTKLPRIIREFREDNDWTQEELGAILGVPRNAVSSWELGRYAPDKKSLEKLKRLGIKSGELTPSDIKVIKLTDQVAHLTKVNLLTVKRNKELMAENDELKAKIAELEEVVKNYG